MTLLRHRDWGSFETVAIPPEADSLEEVQKPWGYEDELVTVWENGALSSDWTFKEIRAKVNAARLRAEFRKIVNRHLARLSRHFCPEIRTSARDCHRCKTWLLPHLPLFPPATKRPHAKRACSDHRHPGGPDGNIEWSDLRRPLLERAYTLHRGHDCEDRT